MYRAKLENVIKNAEEVFIEPGDILVLEKGLYIDQRSKQDPESKLHVVSPVAYGNGQYWYVCPDCQQLHIIKATDVGEIPTWCCVNHEGKRHHYFDGKHVMIKRPRIILDDGC